MIYIGSDHGGYKLKESVKEYFAKANIEFKDVGCNSQASVDYPSIAKKVAMLVQVSEPNKGILICKSGIGMSIVANKFKKIRATMCRTTKDAIMSKRHNNTNVITIGADDTNIEETKEIIKCWLDTVFESGRHEKRVEMIRVIEEEEDDTCGEI